MRARDTMRMTVGARCASLQKAAAERAVIA